MNAVPPWFQQYWWLMIPVRNNRIEDSEVASGRRTDRNTEFGYDRRADRRYPIAADIEYRVATRGKLPETGEGRTVNVSSGGVLFESPRSVPPGTQIELLLAWPVLLDNATGLRLSIVGRTVWAKGNQTAVRILRYDFRIRGTRKKTSAGNAPAR